MENGRILAKVLVRQFLILQTLCKLLSSQCLRETAEAGRLAGEQKEFYFKVPLSDSTHSFLSIRHWLDPGSFLPFNLKQDLTKLHE